MKKTALIILDCQNDFYKGPLAIPDMEKILPRTVKLVKKWKGLVVFVRFILKETLGVHPPDLFLPRTKGAQIVDELLPLTKRKNTIVIDKHYYSAFAKTNLEKILRENKINTIYLTGVKTEYCVLATAFSAFDLGFKVKLVEDCITERDKRFHELILEKKKAEFMFGKNSVVQSKEMV